MDVRTCTLAMVSIGFCCVFHIVFVSTHCLPNYCVPPFPEFTKDGVAVISFFMSRMS